jgi:Family of unknown function (DUF6763)
MSHELEPNVGRWYRNIDKEQFFKVVGIDEDDELIEILHFNGDREEIDTAAWVEMDLETAEAPEDWIDPEDDEEEDEEKDKGDPEEDPDWRESHRRHRPPREGWDEDDDEEDWDDDGGGDD